VSVSVTNPSSMKVRDILSALLRERPTACRVSAALVPEPTDVVAVYRDADGRVGAAWSCHLSLAAGAAVALVGLPKARIHHIKASGFMDEQVEELYFEVADVLGTLINGFGSDPLHLAEVAWDDSLPEDALAMIASAPRKMGYHVEIRGFAEGSLTVFLAD